MQIQFLTSILDCSASEWDALWPLTYPFTKHAFLAALETSGSTTAETGWQPAHVLVRQNGQVVAVMPLYQKSHSYGEYVFDWSWADACQRAGIQYYPKLLCAIPFTPATGPRLGFIASLTTAQKQEAVQTIEQAVQEKLEQLGGSGFHCLFPSAKERPLFSNEKYAQRQGCQFHWFNANFESFDDFLSTFNSRKRKNIKRERQKVVEQGLCFNMRLAAELNSDDWKSFYLLYQRTYFKRSGHQGYLTADFFQQLAKALPQQVLLCSAHKHNLDSPMVAGALYLRDNSTLYGRYWGTQEDLDGLHFETCYYQGIDYAIKEKLQRFDPGAQGEHKIQRGFTPVKTCSYHWLKIPELHNAVKHFVVEEQQHNNAYCEDGRRYLPFKEGCNVVSSEKLLENF